METTLHRMLFTCALMTSLLHHGLSATSASSTSVGASTSGADPDTTTIHTPSTITTSQASTTTSQVSTTTPQVSTTTPQVSTTTPQASTATSQVSTTSQTTTPQDSTTPQVSTTTSQTSTTPQASTTTSQATTPPTSDDSTITTTIATTTPMEADSTTATALQSTTMEYSSTTPCGDPDEVQHIEVVNRTESSLQLKWDEPTNDPACVIGYEVCWQDESSDRSTENCSFSEATNYTVWGLQPCATYNISVQATGSQGNSSAVVISAGTQDSVPGNVLNVEGVDTSTSTLQLRWDEPNRNKFCVVNYTVCWHDTTPIEVRDVCSESAGPNFTISSLQPCSRYNVSVRAQGKAGSSSPSHVLLQTKDAIPGNVRDVRVMAPTSSTMHVEWTKPLENTACVQRYIVCWDEHSCATTVAVSMTVANLHPCTSYNISVMAVGPLENSTTASSQGRTLDADPGEVQHIVLVNRTESSLQLKWDEPTNNPACVVAYEVCWQDDSSDRSTESCSFSEATNYTVWGLQSCATYNIYVQATGSQGNSSAVAISAGTQDSVPGNVLNVEGVDTSTSTLQLRWDEPNRNKFCVVSYTVCWHDTTSNEVLDVCSESAGRNFTISSLQPCSRYNVSVRAQGKAGSSSPSHVLLQTKDAIPGNVSNIVLVDASTSTLQLSWSKPDENKFCVVDYTVCWQDTTSKGTQRLCLESAAANYTIASLQPCSLYNVSVQARGIEGSSSPAYVKFSTQNAVPSIVLDMEEVGRGTSWLQFQWEEPAENPACVLDYVVCWRDARAEGMDMCAHSELRNYTVHDLQPCSTYEVSITARGSAGLSSTVHAPSDTREIAPGPVRNVSSPAVGVHNMTLAWREPSLHAQCVARYGLWWTGPGSEGNPVWTNGTRATLVGLQPQSTYNVSLAAVTEGNLSSRRVYIVVATSSEPQSTSVIICTTVVSILLFGGIAVCTIYMYQKGILIWPPWKKYSLRRKSLTHREIAIKDFRSYCDQLLSNPGQIQSEYQMLVTLSADFSSTMSSTVGHLPDNKKKNRYVNIIPFDATRVKLETSSVGMSDYINASYIKGYSGSVEYIAAQGPKEETCEDFWNMVVQQNVQLIIMLTQFEEKDKVKCFRYFPNLRGNVKFGDVTIHCTTEMMFPIYTQRTFSIYKDGHKKSVRHLHFREWPDFGCPDSTDVMLEFCQVGRQNTESKDMMTVVHCSAGVGRTGTYIGVDILLQHIRENKKVDIFNTVYKMRQQRISMVQSEAQYVYVYQCIRNALDDPAIMNTEKSSSSHSLEPIYENINLALNSSYEKLAKESKKGKKHRKNSSNLCVET